MNAVEIFRTWFDQECDANSKVLSMLDSVQEKRRQSPEFQRALNLVGHLVACRDNWMVRMIGCGAPVAWWPTVDTVSELQPQIRAMESRWHEYLGSLTEEELSRDFEFVLGDGRKMRWNVCGQIMQLVGHSFYHRGQIAMLVDSLGGASVDTDYLYWALQTNQNYGFMADS